MGHQLAAVRGAWALVLSVYDNRPQPAFLTLTVADSILAEPANRHRIIFLRKSWPSTTTTTLFATGRYFFRWQPFLPDFAQK
ncbi:hypothetical protein EH228_13100 [Erwinia endophytica]|nr:hypothetical protein [Erwinia endophytica]KAB8309470.1 hypothetical protein EH228_13100 [Erwinia endophytica]